MRTKILLFLMILTIVASLILCACSDITENTQKPTESSSTGMPEALPSETSSTTASQTPTASTEELHLPEPSLVQPIFLKTIDEFNGILAKGEITDFPKTNTDKDEIIYNAYKSMIERILSLEAIPYPTYDGVLMEISYPDFHIMPEVKTEDAGLHYRINIDDKIYNLYFSCFEPLYKKEFDDGILTYKASRFGNRMWSSDNVVRMKFMGTDVDVYWLEYKTETFDVNQLTFKYNDMIILLGATENSNHAELLDILSHLGIADIRELK